MAASVKALNKLDLHHWPITLSGGDDSRAILYLLKKYAVGKKPLRTLTHGTKKSSYDKKSDAYIADQLAKHENTDHSFYSTDLPNEPIQKVLDRFFYASQGRIDHITGYLDGMKM